MLNVISSVTQCEGKYGKWTVQMTKNGDNVSITLVKGGFGQAANTILLGNREDVNSVLEALREVSQFVGGEC